MIFIYSETLECTYCSYFPINYCPVFSGHTDWSPTLKVSTWKTQNSGCKDIPLEHLLYKAKLKQLVLFGLEIRRAYQGLHVYISPGYVNT